ncbi:hypothetical protein D9M71_802740 [compost metagenome]
MPPLKTLFAEADLALEDPSINDTRSPSSSYNATSTTTPFPQQTARNSEIQATSSLLARYEKHLSKKKQRLSQSPHDQELKEEVKSLSKYVTEVRQQQTERNDRESALLF